MSSPEPNLNIAKVNPSWKDAFNEFKRDIFLSLNCHAVATIEKFDSATQLASVSINYPQTYLRRSSNAAKEQTGPYEQVSEDYPLLLDLPVVIWGGGDAFLTMPIKQGDQCLVAFNDRSIDNWYASGKKASLSSSRSHNVSDGFAIVGLHSKLNPIQDYDANRAVLRNGAAAVGVRKDTGKTLISRNYPTNTQTLGIYLQNLTTAINMLITQIAAISVTGVSSGSGNSGPPVNAVAITAIAATITSIQTNIGNLLE